MQALEATKSLHPKLILFPGLRNMEIDEPRLQKAAEDTLNNQSKAKQYLALQYLGGPQFWKQNSNKIWQQPPESKTAKVGSQTQTPRTKEPATRMILRPRRRAGEVLLHHKHPPKLAARPRSCNKWTQQSRIDKASKGGMPSRRSWS